MKELKEHGLSEDHLRSRAPRTKKIIEAVQQTIRSNLKRCARLMAKYNM